MEQVLGSRSRRYNLKLDSERNWNNPSPHVRITQITILVNNGLFLKWNSNSKLQITKSGFRLPKRHTDLMCNNYDIIDWLYLKTYSLMIIIQIAK